MPPKSAISTASHRAFWLAGHSGTSRRHRGMQSWPGKNAPLLPGHDISAQEPSNLKETFSLAR